MDRSAKALKPAVYLWDFSHSQKPLLGYFLSERISAVAKACTARKAHLFFLKFPLLWKQESIAVIHFWFSGLCVWRVFRGIRWILPKREMYMTSLRHASAVFHINYFFQDKSYVCLHEQFLRVFIQYILIYNFRCMTCCSLLGVMHESFICICRVSKIKGTNHSSEKSHTYNAWRKSDICCTISWSAEDKIHILLDLKVNIGVNQASIGPKSYRETCEYQDSIWNVIFLTEIVQQKTSCPEHVYVSFAKRDTADNTKSSEAYEYCVCRQRMLQHSYAPWKMSQKGTSLPTHMQNESRRNVPTESCD